MAKYAVDVAGFNGRKIRLKVGSEVRSSAVRYVLREKVADTPAGAVFEAINERQQLFAVKFEWKKVSVVNPKLGMEIEILRHLRQKSASPHFVEFVDRAARPLYYFMVTSLTGMNLETVLTERGAKLSVGTAVGVALQVVEGLRELHRLGYVHRDLRPANLCIGRKTQLRNIFLINFGNAAIFFRQNKWRKPRVRVPMRAKGPFAPLSSIDEKEQCAKDDLEALLYSMYYLCDDLPWGVADRTGAREMKLLARTDEKVKERLHAKLDVARMSGLVDYLDSLSYYDHVDYERVQEDLEEAAKEAGVTGVREKYDWEEQFHTVRTGTQSVAHAPETVLEEESSGSGSGGSSGSEATALLAPGTPKSASPFSPT